MWCSIGLERGFGWRGERRYGFYAVLIPDTGILELHTRSPTGCEHGERSSGKHLLLITFLYDQALCSLQVPSLFAASFLEP